MKTYLPKTPRILRKIFPKYTWRFFTTKKEIYLTFDDGPTPKITPFVLNELKKFNAKATFFCIGKNIKNHPTIFKQLLTDGHAVGNHTQNHLNGWKTDTTTYIDNFVKCDETITQFNNRTIQQKLFRPPYGKIKAKQAQAILQKGYTIIMWDVLSADFDTTISKEKCLDNVLKNTENGSIIVFHDSVKAADKLRFVLPKVLAYFTEKEFTFKKIKL